MHRPETMVDTTYEPELIATVRDDRIGLLGYLVVDATIDGHSCGGLRLFDTVNIAELRDLARGMTLKYGYTGTPQGGAKAGIVADPDLPPEEKRRLLRRFGQILAPMLRSGYYNTGPDMSVGHEDIEDMLAAAGISVPAPRRSKGHKSGLYTALAVMVAIEASAEFLRMPLAGRTIAIEGFGSVGTALAALMTRKHKAKVVAVSTTKGAIYNPAGLDVERLLSLQGQHGNNAVNLYEDAQEIDNEELILLPVDILSPCARQYPVTAGNASRIAARLICPGANNAVAHDAEQTLLDRKIPAIPYFAANCGGVLGNKMEVLGVSEEYIENFLRRLNRDRILKLLADSRDTGEPMAFMAEREALARFRRMQQGAGARSLAGRLKKRALGLFNTGLVPESMVRPLGPWYLERTILDPIIHEKAHE